MPASKPGLAMGLVARGTAPLYTCTSSTNKVLSPVLVWPAKSRVMLLPVVVVVTTGGPVLGPSSARAGFSPPTRFTSPLAKVCTPSAPPGPGRLLLTVPLTTRTV